MGEVKPYFSASSMARMAAPPELEMDSRRRPFGLSR
jgi:hypothetical protein